VPFATTVRRSPTGVKLESPSGAISSALATVAFVFIAVDRPGAAAAMILLIFPSGYLVAAAAAMDEAAVARGPRESAAPRR
jgi:hypothetical protein